MKTKIAINGFGRIGRIMFRIAEKNPHLEVVAVNNLCDVQTIAHLLKYDSSYGHFDGEITTQGTDKMIVNGRTVHYTQEKDPTKLPWAQYGVDIVLESTGVFTEKTSASAHLTAGAKKVIITAAAKDADAIICLGVNEDIYNPEKDTVISNASCTTNCMAPITKVINEAFGIEKGLMTTIHSYTNDQNILDLPHKDPRRARAAALSMIPTTTGAATAVAMVIPELKNKLNGISIRVPTPTVSLLDCVFTVKKSTTVEEVNQVLSEAAKKLPQILAVNNEPLVSVDYKGDTHSATVDTLSTMVMEGNLVKIIAWYDNEWGYSCRVVELAELIGKKL